MKNQDHQGSAPAGHAAVAPALAGLAALAVAMGIGRFAFTPMLPMMLRDAGLSIASGGALASANYLGYLLGALGAMLVPLRPGRAIRAGLLTIGVVTAAMGWPLPFAAWLLLRLLAGVASAWVLIAVSAWCLGAQAIHGRPLLNSIVFAGVGAGIAAAGLLCLALTATGAGSARAWTVLGLLALIVTAAIWPCFTAPGSTPAGGAIPPAPAWRWNVDAARLVGCYGVFGFGYIIPATFLPVMASNALRGSAAFGWIWPLFGLAAAISTLAAAALARRLGNRRLWALGHWVMAVGMLLPVWLPGLPAILVAALCVGGSFMVITLVALQEARRLAGRNATVLIAAMTSAFACGQIVGPLCVRAAVGNAGFSGALVVAALLLAASALLLTRPRSDH